MTNTQQFDAIVVGSGITGGWAAKELTQAGLKVLMIERGRDIQQGDYPNETKAPWELPFRGRGDQEDWQKNYQIQRGARNFDEWTSDHWVKDSENPYSTAPGTEFNWYRGYHTGGRSLLWGRQCYRWSDYDFGANKKDGHGVDWPIRYADLAPWYDHVEEFIGVAGSIENMPSLPDGHFQPPMALNVVEKHVKQAIESRYHDRKLIIGRTANLTQAKGDRSNCQYRNICARGCSYGAYFSTQSSTLPAAQATNNLTFITDTLVERVNYNPKTKRVTGVDVKNAKTGAQTTYNAKIVFLNAGSFNSNYLLLRSTSENFQHGLANSSGVLGTHIMDHAMTVGAVAIIPGFDDRTTLGNRPTGIVIPRYRNLADESHDFVRGYSFQGGALQTGYMRGHSEAGLGVDFKNDLRHPGPWRMILTSFVESLPRPTNKLTLDSKLGPDGNPLLKIDFRHGDNEHRALKDAASEARTMLELAGGKIIFSLDQPGAGGSSIHEMGGARMGHDPATSVLNKFNQAHDIPNLFVTDGAAMASSACQNPSLTYMALTARACAHAVTLLKQGTI